MNSTLGRRSARLSVALGAALALTAVLAVPAVPRASSGGATTFQDSTAEVTGAPDIGRVTISQDGEVLTVAADVADMPALGEEGAALFALDTDGDATTGEFGGADYILYWDLKTWQGAPQRWNGSKYVAAKKVRDPSRSLIGGASIGFMFNLANFAWPKRVEVSVTVIRGAPGSDLVDQAPDTGPWGFDVRPTMTTFDLDFAPTRPHAGSVFAGAHPKVMLSDGTTHPPKAFSCTALLGGVRLAGLGRSGACRWRIPPGVTGKMFAVDASVTYRGEQSDFGTWRFRVG